MSDQFDPNWPHGHECITSGGEVREAIIIRIDQCGGTPVVAEVLREWNVWDIMKFPPDGFYRSKTGPSYRLINRATPEAVK